MKNFKLLFLVGMICLGTIQSVKAQDFLLQGWYWQYPKSPLGTNFAFTLNQQASMFAESGFTHIWLPPLSRATSGGFSNGYDVKDLFDLGDPALGATGFGSRAEVDALISNLTELDIDVLADVVYNHRDGGKPEDNPFVEEWIENLTFGEVATGNNPYPSDRFRCYLPLGGLSGNGAGDYYFKISSSSQHPNFHGKDYNVFMFTKRKGGQGLPAEVESEPNGGGDCGQPFNDIQVGVVMQANVDGSGCTVDEFHLELTNADFFVGGDTLFIELFNPNGNYSDHRIYSLWSGSASADIADQIGYQTRTNFMNMPSGRGGMNYTSFKPNGTPTNLGGDWDQMLFFYDYDNFHTPTRDTLFEWTKWLWEDVGVRGLRLDAVKHFTPSFTGQLMNYMHDNNHDLSLVVAEFYDFNPFLLNGWVGDVKSSMSNPAKEAIDVRAFDFALRGSLKEACDAFGYDARSVFQSGMVDGAGGSPFEAVTFVNNHDFISPGQPVQNDPQLAYAYILTNNQIGLPCVYYPEYMGVSVPNAPNVNLKNEIDDLMAAHKKYVAGANSRTYLNKFGTFYTGNYTEGSAANTLLYQLTNTESGYDVIVAINFSGGNLKVDHSINTGVTNLGSGSVLYPVAGTSNVDSLTVDGSFVYIDLPPRSYAVYVNCNTPPAPSNPQGTEVCDGEAAPMSVDDAGWTYNWYDAPAGGSLLAENTAQYTPIEAGSYWVEAVDDCGTSVRVEVVATEGIGCAAVCETPVNLLANPNSAGTGVSLSWNAVQDAMLYQVKGRVAGTTPYASTITANNFKSVGGLNPGTTYEWVVRVKCNSGEITAFSAPQTFSTPLNTLKIADTDEVDMVLYPSPAKEALYINYTLPEAGETSIGIVNILGEEVIRFNSTSHAGINSRHVDISALSAGTYIVRLSQGNVNLGRQFIVVD